MQEYELMVLITSTLTDGEAEALSRESVVAMLEENGVQMTFQDFWGSRGLAYTIKGQKWGYYFVCRFTGASSAALIEIKKSLNINTSLLRWLLTSVEKDSPAPVKYSEQKKEWDALDTDRKIDKVLNMDTADTSD